MDLSLLMQTNFMARTSLAFACPIIKARPANCKRLFCPRNPKISLDFCDIRLKAEILHRTNANSQKLPHLRRGGVLPRPRRMHNRNRTTNGDPVQRPVGADASVRPLGNYGFAATFRQIGHAPCGESAASTPTNVVRIRIGASVFAGLCRRADRVVRPYGCARVCIGASGFATSYRAGGACPSRVFLLCLHFARPAKRVGLCAPLDAGQLVVELL